MMGWPNNFVQYTYDINGNVVGLVDAFEVLLNKYNFVGNGIADDSTALQLAIEDAKNIGITCKIPDRVTTIKLNSGITIYSDKTSLIASKKVILDCSGMTTGAAVTISSTITDTNSAPLSNVQNKLSGFYFSGNLVAGVTAIYIGSATLKTYLYHIENCSFNQFETSVDLYSNSFGINFSNCAFKSSTGTLIKCLTGGTNYGERYSFINCLFYNSARILYNTNPNATFKFLSCSLDYSTVVADIASGRVTMESCHIETNLDDDYMFKLSTNESSSLILDKCDLLLTGARATYEIFSIDANVIFGGISVRDTMLSAASGYSLASLVSGVNKAIVDNLFRFTSNTKPPFSRYINQVRAGNTYASASALCLAEYSLTGTVTIDTVNFAGTATGSLNFAAAVGVSSAFVTVPRKAKEHTTISLWHKNSGSPTAGQAKLQILVAYLDKKGSVIGSTATIDDINSQATFTLRTVNINTQAPIGTDSIKITFQKSADVGAVGVLYLSDIIINTY